MTHKYELPAKFLESLKEITGKRPKTVIDHILKHGSITSEELKDIYGYNHPPRAVRDVREKGVPIETYRVEGTDGRKIASYRFGDPKESRFNKLDGRTALSTELKEKLVHQHGAKCFIHMESLDKKLLQIDHRIPYEVAGDSDGSIAFNPDDFMLLSASANRAKSWSCENCTNWNNERKIEVCSQCYWAFPENYTHIAMKNLRRIDLLWQDSEIEQFDELSAESSNAEISIQKLIKDIIAKRKK